MTHLLRGPRLIRNSRDEHAHVAPRPLSPKTLFVMLVIVVASHSALSEPINVGVLVPSEGPLSVLGEQVYTAARIAREDLLNDDEPRSELVIHRIATPWSHANPYTLPTVRAQLTEAQIDFVIGGYTPEQSAYLNAVANEWHVPTILLAPTGSSAASSIQSDFVLEMGDTVDQVYKRSVKEWADEYVNVSADQKGLRTIAILFDFEDDTSYRFGTDLTPQAIPESEFNIAEVPYSRPGRPYYTFAIDQVRQLDPAGVIVSGSPLDAANIIRNIGTELDVPIFITTPTGWSDQTAAFVRGAYSPEGIAPPDTFSSIYYGSQVWSDPTAENIDLATRLRTELGWSNGAISSRALQAYDAVRVIDEIWSKGNATGDNPWVFDQTIAGYTTQFAIEDNRLVAPYGVTELDAISLSFVSP